MLSTNTPPIIVPEPEFRKSVVVTHVGRTYCVTVRWQSRDDSTSSVSNGCVTVEPWRSYV